MVEDTVRYNFGLPVDDIAYVRMESFVEFVDEGLGGLDVEVRNPVLDKCSDIVLNYAPGTHFMDGKTALCYTRARMSSGGFAREERQRDVILAMKNKVLETAEERPVLFAMTLIDEYMNQYRYTTIDPVEMVEIGWKFMGAKDNITEYQMGYDVGLKQLTHPITGAWLLIPPPPECVSNLMHLAVMGEPWDMIPADYLESVCGVD